MRASGMIFAACTIAESRPACTHSWRNTELSTWRAAGERPKETLETPSVVYTPGSSALMRRMASMVAMPSPRRSSSPVESGKVSASKMQVLGLEPVALDGEVVDAVGDPQLPLDVAGLAHLVDEQADDRGAVLLGQAEHPVEAGALVVAVLEVGRVQQRPAAQPLQPGLHDLRLGGVEHERHRGLGAEAAGDLVHVDGAVAADVVDADVEHVGALADLVLGHLDGRVQSSASIASRKLLRAVGVRPLADDQERRVLLEGSERVDRGGARLPVGRRARPAAGRAALGQDADVLRRRAAAAADDGTP